MSVSQSNATYMSTKQAASKAGLSVAQINRACLGRVANAPKLPNIRVGRRRLIRAESLDRWMEALEVR